DDHGGEAYDHRDSGAEDEPREHVAPEVIGAEQVLLASARLPRRRPEAVAERAQLGIVGGEGVREDRDQRHRDDDRRRDDRKPFRAEGREAPGEGQGRGAAAVHRGPTVQYRILGSMTAYRMSTRRLTITIIAPPSRTVACTTGKSRKAMPSSSSRPTPGQAKTVSTTTATVTMMTRLISASVSSGIS